MIAKKLLNRKTSFTTGKPTENEIRSSSIAWPPSYIEFLSEFGSGVVTTYDLPTDCESGTIHSCKIFSILSPFEKIGRHSLYYIGAVETANEASLTNYCPEGARLGFWKGDLIPIGSLSGRELICFQNQGVDKEWTISIFDPPFSVVHLQLTFGRFVDAVLQGKIDDINLGDFPGSLKFYWFPLYNFKEATDTEPSPSGDLIESSFTEVVPDD